MAGVGGSDAWVEPPGCSARAGGGAGSAGVAGNTRPARAAPAARDAGRAGRAGRAGPRPAGYRGSRRGCTHPDGELAVDRAGHHGFLVHVGSCVGLGVDGPRERRRKGAQLLPSVACIVGGPKAGGRELRPGCSADGGGPNF